MSKSFRQSGVSFVNFLMTCVTIAVVAILVIKVLPEYITYYKVTTHVRAVAKEANSNPTITVQEIRSSLNKRFDVDGIDKDVPVAELDIGKSPSNQVEISFDYKRIVPLFGNISLIINFKGSSDS